MLTVLSKDTEYSKYLQAIVSLLFLSSPLECPIELDPVNTT